MPNDRLPLVRPPTLHHCHAHHAEATGRDPGETSPVRGIRAVVAGVIMLDSHMCVCTTRKHTCAQAAQPDVPSQGPRPWNVHLTQPPRKHAMGIFSFQEHTLLPQVGGHRRLGAPGAPGASVLTRSGSLETGRKAAAATAEALGFWGTSLLRAAGGPLGRLPAVGARAEALGPVHPSCLSLLPSVAPVSALDAPGGPLQAPRVWGSWGSGSPTVGLPGREALSLCLRSSHCVPLPPAGWSRTEPRTRGQAGVTGGQPSGRSHEATGRAAPAGEAL